MKEINSTSDFKKDVLESSLPVLIDFFAPWCGPCRAIAPIVEEVAEEKKDVINVFKVNVDNLTEVAGEFGIQSIPTLMIFKDGNLKDQQVGSLGKDALIKWIDKNL